MSKKFLKNGGHLTFISSKGEILSKDFGSDIKTIMHITELENEEDIIEYFKPQYKERLEEYNKNQDFLERLKKSKILRLEGVVITIPSISKMSVPQDLASVILEAEENENDDILKCCLNFWKLCVLNPSEITRQNLFWFLNKNGMTLTKSGLFVAYRNVILKGKEFLDLNFCHAITDNYIKIKNWKKAPSNYNLWFNSYENTYLVQPSHIELIETICCDVEYEDEEGNIYEDEECVDRYKLKGNLQELYNNLKEHNNQDSITFTDSFSKTTTINIGVPVSIPREECNNDNEVTCSRGYDIMLVPIVVIL